jgi:hypothetical protein
MNFVFRGNKKCMIREIAENLEHSGFSVQRNWSSNKSELFAEFCRGLKIERREVLPSQFPDLSSTENMWFD